MSGYYVFPDHSSIDNLLWGMSGHPDSRSHAQPAVVIEKLACTSSIDL